MKQSRREFIGLVAASAAPASCMAYAAGDVRATGGTTGRGAAQTPFHIPWTPFERIKVKGWDFGGGRMLCFANRSSEQMLSTVFVSKGGRLAVVDGGGFKDGDFLFGKLMELGGRIDHWFITHAHSDHYGALCTMLKRPDFARLKIGELVYSFPDLEWIEKSGEPGSRKSAAAFLGRLADAGASIPQRRYVKGEVVEMDGVTFETLNDYNLDIIKIDPVNGTTICLGVNMGNRRILVTGDVSANEGHWLASTADKSKFKADIVFMAHHGQQGAPRRFYEMVKPEAAIWPAPQWLWENIAFGGSCPGSGPFHTNYTKTWMQDLKVKLHYPMVRDYEFC